jgi:hypothetical protein
LGFGSGRSFSIIFCTLFVHLFFNWAAVTGRRISNRPTSQSPIVVGGNATTTQNIAKFGLDNNFDLTTFTEKLRQWILN